MAERMRLLAMKAPLHNERAILRLLEPAGSCRNLLWERLFNGTYDKPFIIDRGVRRFLHFDLCSSPTWPKSIWGELCQSAWSHRSKWRGEIDRPRFNVGTAEGFFYALVKGASQGV